MSFFFPLTTLTTRYLNFIPYVLGVKKQMEENDILKPQVKFYQSVGISIGAIKRALWPLYI